MRAGITALTASAIALSACAGDNPDNVPEYGDWEMTTRVDSVSINGTILPPENLPPEFRALETTENRCGEPMFKDREWQLADIARKSGADCTAERFDESPTEVSGDGRCIDVGNNGFNPAYSFRATQGPDSYRLVVTLEGSATIRGVSGQHYIKATAVQQGTRTGDC